MNSVPPRAAPPSPTLRLVVAINAYASFGRRSDVGPRVVVALRAAGHDVTVRSEVSFELLRLEVLALLVPGVDVLVVVGGDGMVSLGTNLLAGRTIPLAIVPCGTGNDLARGLGIPVDDTDAAIRHLLAALARAPRAIDCGRATCGDVTTWFAGVLSAGFDAVVNERANRMRRPRGKSRYTLAMLLVLATFKPLTYRLTVDGVERTQRAMLISVANNVSIGGGMRIAPDAVIDDGLLDLFVVTPLSRIGFLRVFPKVFSGTHTGLPQVEITRCRSVRMDAEGVFAYADGERIGALPVQVDVVPGALFVCA
ncbi:diacylglycerol kinase [Cryobacterium sp. TMT1-21]|uniref:diacylglycerol kinase family protein n=1 Tax=unclassified Cryobacterium TaxID=2649013 RepID=UPI00106ACF4D|nr:MULTISPECIES: diacylglycerol kinase family protein [unclassified Cryobacterium]TFC87800.1 diacylglycerol kinase [Cryobacterium sp. TmT2-59]TFD12444.1 diacylglycerol kinase [Cryobacterium sp. TMT1-21]TFD19384.1 diacylglycerol kinase [Cryobacterium sp. TMT2-23]TFD19886.1 diacylglycerol kinase [Cryobacterium sp. TMT4-10]TFD35288.1 diacylglycerol kinase [Cryobacterium sp. TMT2-10]